MISIFYKILIGTSLIGIIAGIVGCFMLLSKKSLLGDTIAHATLPGIAGIFLLTGQQNYWSLIFGATASGLASAYLVEYIVNHSTLKKDAALGIVLSTFFSLGIIFLTIIQKFQMQHQAGIDKFLFGQAATLLNEDIIMITVIAAVILIILYIFYPQFTIIILDPVYAQTIAVPVHRYKKLLLLCMILTIIAGLHIVGLILMSSFLITPAAAARQLTKNLKSMIKLTIIFSLVASSSGTWLSYTYPRVPTGPAIVIIATCITLISMFACWYQKNRIYSS